MKYRSNNILVFVQLTEDGKKVLKQALFFRQWLGMRLFVYHTINKSSFIKRLFVPQLAKKHRNESLHSLREFVETVASPEELKHISFRVLESKPLSALLKESKNGGFEFMVVAKSKSGNGMETNDFNKLISQSECPVMAVSQDFQVTKIKKIVIPVDISQSVNKKLLWATYFAKKFNAHISIVSALGINIKTKQSLAWRNSEKLKQMLSKRGVDCEVKILKTSGEDKHSTILNYLETEKPDLVIIRTHQESKLTGVQIGKFVSEIIHNSKIPVFAVTRQMHPMPADFEI